MCYLQLVARANNMFEDKISYHTLASSIEFIIMKDIKSLGCLCYSNSRCLSILPVAIIGFTSATYSGVEGSQISLLVEGDGQNQQALTVQYSVLRSGTAGSMHNSHLRTDVAKNYT